MTIKIFGELKDIIKDENISFDNVANIQELKEKLFQSFPGLQEKKFAIAVNKKIVNQNISIQHDAEIALLPPFSGG